MAICPYRGLDAFREEDSAFFFGRGSADDPASPIGQLVRKVREHPVCDGGRPIGQRQVFARLCRSGAGAAARARSVLERPVLAAGPEPLRALAAAFNPRTDDEGAAEYATKISNEAEKLRTGDPDLLSHMIREELDQAEGKPDRLLLYIDQWEELYAQAPSPGRPGASRPARGRCQSLHRFVADCSAIGAGFGGRDRARRLLRSADWPSGHPSHCCRPSRSCSVRCHAPSWRARSSSRREKSGSHSIPRTLVQRILDEAGEDEGMLPLLQYALKETWDQREGNRLTADSYARSGGVREAIRITAERTFEALSPEDQQAARQLFLRLVTPGEGQEDTRARAAMPTEADAAQNRGAICRPADTAVGDRTGTAPNARRLKSRMRR